jgi:hypothetical protein
MNIKLDLPKTVELTEEEILFLKLFTNYETTIKLNFVTNQESCYSVSFLNTRKETPLRLKNTEGLYKKMIRVGDQLNKKAHHCYAAYTKFNGKIGEDAFLCEAYFHLREIGHFLLREVWSDTGFFSTNEQQEEAFKKFMEI